MLKKIQYFTTSLLLHLTFAILLLNFHSIISVKHSGQSIVQAYLFNANTRKLLNVKKIIGNNQTMTNSSITQNAASSEYPTPNRSKKTLEDKLIHPTSSPNKKSKGKHSLILEKLHDAIYKNIIYPNQAKFLNIIGTTQLIFKLKVNGRIEDVHIRKSSGSPILDQAALNTMRKISPFKFARTHLDETQTFTISITFEQT